MHFIINFLNILGFLLLTSEKKKNNNGDDTFLNSYIFSDLFIDFWMITIHGYSSLNIFYDLFKCLRFLKGCLNAILQFPSHLQENLEKNTHAPD